MSFQPLRLFLLISTPNVLFVNPNITSYQYRSCRLIGHSWHDVPSDWNPAPDVPMTLRCADCDVERRDTIGRNTGEVIRRHYTYPIGYLFDHDDDKPTRTDFRLAWVEDAVAKIREARQARRA